MFDETIFYIVLGFWTSHLAISLSHWIPVNEAKIGHNRLYHEVNRAVQISQQKWLYERYLVMKLTHFIVKRSGSFHYQFQTYRQQ